MIILRYILHLQFSVLQIFVDRKNLSVILPINGFAATFHINSIKNASKSDEGEYTFLRINFQTPGQLAGKKEDTVSIIFNVVGSKLKFCVNSPLKIQMLLLFAPYLIGLQMAIASINYSNRSRI